MNCSQDQLSAAEGPTDSRSRYQTATKRRTDLEPLSTTLSSEPEFSMSYAGEPESTESDESFYDRKPTVEFKPPTPDWGYLAQVNEKFRNVLTWDVERIPGEPAHRAMFQCTPGRSAPFVATVWRLTSGVPLLQQTTSTF